MPPCGRTPIDELRRLATERLTHTRSEHRKLSVDAGNMGEDVGRGADIRPLLGVELEVGNVVVIAVLVLMVLGFEAGLFDSVEPVIEFAAVVGDDIRGLAVNSVLRRLLPDSEEAELLGCDKPMDRDAEVAVFVGFEAAILDSDVDNGVTTRVAAALA